MCGLEGLSVFFISTVLHALDVLSVQGAEGICTLSAGSD
jgi:hypothetical protein